MNAIEVGEKLTVVFNEHGNGMNTSNIVWAGDIMAGGFFTARVADRGGSHWSFDNEGVTWIRGHHERGSVEALALLAAYALRTQP